MTGKTRCKKSLRGRGEAKAPQQTHHNDQDYPFSPPPQLSRYPTRRRESLRGPYFSDVPCRVRNPVRNIIHSTVEQPVCDVAADIVKASVSDCCSPQDNLGKDQAQQATDPQANIAEDNTAAANLDIVSMSISTQSPGSCGHIVSDKQDVELISKYQVPEAAQQVGDLQPSRENVVVLHVQEKPERSKTNYSHRNSRCLSGPTSFNITEFAQRFQDDMEEDPEVQSSLDPAYNWVHMFNVKAEYAPILRDIFDRYGDITSQSEFKSPAILSSLLEHVCDTCKRLKEAKFGEVLIRELEEMVTTARDLESQKLNVGWLREKVESVIKAQTDFHQYLDVKKKAVEHDASIRRREEELETYEKELVLMKQKIFVAAEDLLVKRAEADHLRRVALDIKDRVKPLVQHGLLW